MASRDHTSDSEESADPLDLINTPQKNREKDSSLPASTLSHRFKASPEVRQDEERLVRNSASKEKKIAVMVQGPSRPWEYQPFVADQTVDEVLAEIDQPGGDVWYRIEYEDGRREDVSIKSLLVVLVICFHCVRRRVA